MSAKKTKGKDLIVYINGIPVLYDKTSTLQYTSKNVDTTSRASADGNGTLWEESVPISIGSTITGSGFLVNDNPSGGAPVYSLGRLFEAMRNQTLVYVTFKSADGLWLYGSDAFIMDIKISADISNVGMYDYTIKANGITQTIPVS